MLESRLKKGKFQLIGINLKVMEQQKEGLIVG
jgi:hypothetical protein